MIIYMSQINNVILYKFYDNFQFNFYFVGKGYLSKIIMCIFIFEIIFWFNLFFVIESGF